ncbi:hypothetical protein CEXT_791971 [Caerostris extrusa]|uniref:Uncharacterized protein n=1 Tax=Caerostris extrusa TaxID=172846 RepID=A0AAV4VF85_CAEEX|nr:hypothetical protein CEXT_791971 [Caerostris extrusa]
MFSFILQSFDCRNLPQLCLEQQSNKKERQCVWKENLTSKENIFFPIKKNNPSGMKPFEEVHVFILEMRALFAPRGMDGWRP